MPAGVTSEYSVRAIGRALALDIDRVRPRQALFATRGAIVDGFIGIALTFIRHCVLRGFDRSPDA